MKYRFDENACRSFVGAGVTIGTGWSSFRDVTAVGNTCKRTYPATTQSVSVQSTRAIEVLSASNDTVDMAYTNINGTMRQGHANTNSIDTMVMPTINEGLDTSRDDRPW